MPFDYLLLVPQFSSPLPHSWQHLLSKALIRPFELFASEPIIQLLGLYMAFIYGIFYRKP